MSQEWITTMWVHQLPNGANQPFYNVLVQDGTCRYAAQGMGHLHQVVKRDFVCSLKFDKKVIINKANRFSIEGATTNTSSKIIKTIHQYQSVHDYFNVMLQ